MVHWGSTLLPHYTAYLRPSPPEKRSSDGEGDRYGDPHGQGDFCRVVKNTIIEDSDHRRFYATMVAGACFGATKTDVVCFSLKRILEPMAIPGICGNGHLLTPDNLKVDQAKRRWRCRRCGRARAADFRARHKPAA